MKFLTLLSLFFITLLSYSENCNLEFDRNVITQNETTGNQVILEIPIVNTGSSSIKVTSTSILSSFSNDFTLNYSNTLDVGASDNITINFTPIHNIQHSALIVLNIECEGETYEEHIEFSVTANSPNSYYSSTYNLWGEDLKSALKTVVTSTHQPRSYNDSRDYMYTFVDNKNNTLECVYTGRTINHTTGRPNVNTTGINTEHTWPQSFGASQEPAKSDGHHFHPSDQDANSRRANTKYGDVVSSIIWEQGGSKLGSDDIGRTRFEPRAIKKGDMARGLFYFATRYGNIDEYLTDQEDVLREWSSNDMPDQLEIDRNNGIFDMQKNRNPFVDHPEFLERIPNLSFNQDIDRTPSSAFSSEEITLDLKDQTDILTENEPYVIKLFNDGLSNISITNVTANSPQPLQQLDFTNTPIAPGTSGTIELIPADFEHQIVLSITTTDNTYSKTINVKPNVISVETTPEALPYTFSNGYLIINQENHSLSLPNGKLLPNDGNYQLEKGLYLLKVDNQTYKIYYSGQ
ncbi:MAG: hypothetical protein Kapaf2KO_15870 [Candidatus Kapaibacteriales bacterium]